VFLLLAACVTEANFAARSTSVLCHRYEECDRASFEKAYDSVSDCIDDVEPPLRDYYECLGGECSFDAGEATACLNGYKEQTCEDAMDGAAPDACNHVYDGCSTADMVGCAVDASI
jgi:hypothetical protein